MFASVRIAVRSLARRPAVALVAIASLAVGIGVNSAVFSIVDALFLRPPAITNPENLVQIYGMFKATGRFGALDWADYETIASQTPAFSDVTTTMGRGGLWRHGDESTLLLVDAVGDNYFRMLGVKPLLGAIPDPKTIASESEPPIILTYWFWRERTGGRAEVIGERMEFRDHLWRIAAVLPPAFRGLNPMGMRHVWIGATSWSRYFREDLERGNGQFEVVARLQPGVSLEQAQAQLDTLAKGIESSDSRVAKGLSFSASSVARDMRDRLKPGAFVLAVVALVLLIACANVAAVLLAHAEARRREIGLRLTLGAGRLALIRQFLTESAVLAVLGAGVGLLLSSWLLNLVPVLAPPNGFPMNFDFRIDARLLLFTAASVAATLVIFGFAPLAYALRVPLLEAISGSRSVGRTQRSISRYALVTVQISLSVVLVGSAVVLMRSLLDAGQIYPGYDTSRPLALVWGYRTEAPSGKSEDAIFSEAADRIAAAGGVEAVTYARHLALVGSGSGASVSATPEGWPAGTPAPRVYFNLVGPRFFEVVGARISGGRAFADSDHNGGAPVTVISAEAARRFWPGQNPLGKTLTLWKEQYQVVGVATDGRISGIHETPTPVLYIPFSRRQWGETILIARTKADPASILKVLAKTAAQTPGLRVYQSMTLRALLKDALYMDWIPTVLGGLLAAVGILLAAGGLYGAVSYATERRLSEFGVRMAVGARGSQIAKLVLLNAARLCAAGIPVGIGLFVVLYRYLSSVLLRGRPLDPFAIATGVAITLTVVLAGAVLPAMRAARLDPIDVLRAE